MIYIVISILLVSSGIFLFLFALFHSGEQVKSSDAADRKKQQNKENIHRDEKENIRSVTAIYHDNGVISEIKEELKPEETADDNHVKPPAGNHQNDEIKFNAVFFEDSSGAVDYSTLSVPLDLNADYSGFKRVGAGELLVDKSGFNFKSDKNFFRFDFHKIREIKTGSNYMALMPSSDAASKLFIFDREYSEIKTAEEMYLLGRKG